MTRSILRIASITGILILILTPGNAQNTFPEILNTGTIREQMDYIQDRTLIYENYRAIREDMFQKVKTNSVDSLDKSKREILELKKHSSELDQRIDSLGSSLDGTKADLQQVTRSKNSISIAGIELNKSVYNTIMWLIVAGLVVILILGYLSFRINLKVTRTTKKDLQELKDEYEEYRKKTRLDREKVSMEHFREIQKLKGTQY